MPIKQPTRPIILIHGISTDGQWQEVLAPLLGIFFDVVPVKYRQFRRLGGLKVVAEPVVLTVVFFVALVHALTGLGPSWLKWALPALAVFAFTPPFLFFRRRAALRAYTRAAGDRFAGQPNLIAHSFGTYLTVRLIRRLPAVRFYRIVLVGCVLPQKLRWTFLRERAEIDAVLNVWTSNDIVPFFAKLAYWLRHKDLGDAGRKRFVSGVDRVHDIATPETLCVDCLANIAHVHNVDHSPTDHSENLLIVSNLTLYWLPFFWNMSVSDYGALRQYCQKYAAASFAYRGSAIKTLTADAMSTAYDWTDGTLWEHIRQALQAENLPQDDRTVSLALSFFAISMDEAFKANPSKARALLNLSPFNAVRWSVTEVRRALQ